MVPYLRCLQYDRARDFPGGPVVKTPCFHCMGHEFKSLVGELRPHMPHSVAKKKKQHDRARMHPHTTSRASYRFTQSSQM